jgi:hypothetical protein
MVSPEQYLAAATMSLPGPVAASMEEALAQGAYRIRAGRYGDGNAVCPLGAADALAGSKASGSWDDHVLGADSDDGYGGRVLRFAVSFDLCAAHVGLDTALEVVKATLARREVERAKRVGRQPAGASIV